MRGAGPPRVLFVPVSGPRGTGEYARSVAIAAAIVRRWPQASIHFLLSSAAPYARSAPFPATLLPSSPTFHSAKVAQSIEHFRPTLVIFDNAGRTAQLRAARRAGARVVYISSRARQRRKAFRLRWMRLIDEHWIAWPRVLAGDLSLFERWKLRWQARYQARFLDTLLPDIDPVEQDAVLRRLDLRKGDYVLLAPGGGASHRDLAHAPLVVAEAAEHIAARGFPTVLVSLQGPTRADSALKHIPPVPMTEFVTLIRHARLVICNGGDTLLQALACRRPCVAIPMAPDQIRRLGCFQKAGVPVGVALDAAAIQSAALRLLEDAAASAALLETYGRCPLADGMPPALDAVARLVD